MDKLQNHPYGELLAAYSAGSLPLSQALCISAHLEHCDSCTRKLQRLNRVGTELMQQLTPSKASDELKNRLLEQLDSLEAETPKHESARVDPSIPRCLRQFVDSSYGDLRWKLTLIEPKGAALTDFDALVPPLDHCAQAVREAIAHAQHEAPLLRVSHEGFPLCQLPELRHLASGLHEHGFTVMSEADEGQFFVVDYGARVYPEACAPCTERSACPGLYRSYDVLRGSDALRPFLQATV